MPLFIVPLQLPLPIAVASLSLRMHAAGLPLAPFGLPGKCCLPAFRTPTPKLREFKLDWPLVRHYYVRMQCDLLPFARA